MKIILKTRGLWLNLQINIFKCFSVNFMKWVSLHFIFVSLSLLCDSSLQKKPFLFMKYLICPKNGAQFIWIKYVKNCQVEKLLNLKTRGQRWNLCTFDQKIDVRFSHNFACFLSAIETDHTSVGPAWINIMYNKTN